MPDNTEQTWDDLYAETAPAAPAPIIEDDIDDIRPAAATDSDLERVANADVDPATGEVDPAAPPVVEPEVENDPPANPENANDANTVVEDPPPADPNEDLTSMTGIERYLAQFDIEGGMISFDDNSQKHFNELEPDKQVEILSQLHQANSASVESKYGLDENEIGLLNYLRTNKLTVEQMIDGMATDRVKTLMAVQEMDTKDFTAASEDEIYLQFLKRSDPEATAETLEADLAKAKEQSNFTKVAENLRKQYIEEQTQAVKGKLLEDKRNQGQEIEDQRREVVNAVSGINDVAGVTLNDNIKNGILDRVLEVNEHGDSRFMEEVFGDPNKLFNAAFWYYYGSSVLDQRDTYWKQQKSAAFKRGREEALGGSDSQRISFTGKEPERSAPTKTGEDAPPADDDWLTLHT